MILAHLLRLVCTRRSRRLAEPYPLSPPLGVGADDFTRYTSRFPPAPRRGAKPLDERRRPRRQPAALPSLIDAAPTSASCAPSTRRASPRRARGRLTSALQRAESGAFRILGAHPDDALRQPREGTLLSALYVAGAPSLVAFRMTQPRSADGSSTRPFAASTAPVTGLGWCTTRSPSLESPVLQKPEKPRERDHRRAELDEIVEIALPRTRALLSTGSCGVRARAPRCAGTAPARSRANDPGMSDPCR